MKPRIAVAYSGGRDSTALLHATLAAAAEQGIGVVAIHVHHGLSAHADAWLAHCEAQCARWAKRGWPVSFEADRLSERPPKGESIEAWARRARYRALRRLALANDAEIVMLAHHRRDQAETFLLQALRAAGVAGLSGMPREIERDGITWARPWLDVSREQVEAYVRRHRLRFVDDDSNADPRFARNRLRLAVWPALSQAFPSAEATLAAAAEWAQEATACLSELAAMDLATAQTPAGGLDVRGWSALSPARRVNVLRAWLKGAIGQAPDASLVRRLALELEGTGSAQWPTAGGRLARYRGVLKFLAESAGEPASPAEQVLSIKRAGDYKVPAWRGELRVERVKAGGVPISMLSAATLRARTGGEQFQSGPGRPPRSLKKQFQAAAMPAWERSGPLVYHGETLLFVPGLGIDARAIAPEGVPQATLTWIPHAA